MARTRLLHPEFFKHDELAKLSPLHRLLFQGLWTIADREGRLSDRPARIRVETLPYDDCDVDSMLSDLARGGFIVRYEVAAQKLIAIPSFLSWQKPHKNEQASELSGPLEPGVEHNQGGVEEQPRIVDVPDNDGSRRAVSISVSVSDPVSVSVQKPASIAEKTGDATLAPALLKLEPPDAPPSELVAYMTSVWPFKRAACEKLEHDARDAFPTLDLLAEAKKCKAWQTANNRPRRTTKSLFSWWTQALERGGAATKPTAKSWAAEQAERDQAEREKAQRGRDAVNKANADHERRARELRAEQERRDRESIEMSQPGWTPKGVAP